MKFSPDLERGTLLRRYKRFLADVEVDGRQFTVHCPNTGAMTNCAVSGSDCWVLDSHNDKRKYRYTWEVATTSTGHLACINTLRANHLVAEAIADEVIAPLAGYEEVSREVKYGAENSRIDFLLTRGDEKCFVEVKSVTLGVGDGLGLFPDAKSARALKHVRELLAVKQQGHRAVLLFCVQHTGIERVAPADDVDPEYGAVLREAVHQGLEVLAYRARIDCESIALVAPVPVCL